MEFFSWQIASWRNTLTVIIWSMNIITIYAISDCDGNSIQHDMTAERWTVDNGQSIISR